MPPKKATAASQKAKTNGTRTTKPVNTKAKTTTTAKQTKVKAAEASSSAKKASIKSGVNGTKQPEPASNKRKRAAAVDHGDEDEDGGARRKKSTKSVSNGQRPAKAKSEPKTAINGPSKAPAEQPTLNQPPRGRLAVYVTGTGECGELGLGPKRTSALVARPIPSLDADDASSNHTAVQLCCGGMHTIVLTSDNKILTWGVNDDGALGRNTDWDGGLKDMDGASDSEDDDGELNPHECQPKEVPSDHFPSGTVFTQVAAGDSCSFVLTANGDVYGWGAFRDTQGNNRFGYDQNGKLIEVQRVPALVPHLNDIVQIVCGANHALALDKSGQIWAWGAHEQNQLGQKPFGRHSETLLPRRVRICTRPMKYIASGQYHSFAIDDRDNVWGWGLNSFGEAGYAKAAGGDQSVLPNPIKIQDLCRKSVTVLAGGAHHSGAVTADGTCYVWGRYDGGQLGIKFSDAQLNDDTLVRRDEYDKPRICLRPTIVKEVGKVSDIACGTDHTVFISQAGAGFATGFNSNGQLGLGNEEDQDTVQKLHEKYIMGEKLVSASAGGQFTMVTSSV